VSPRIKSADVLLEFIRRGAVQSVRTLGEEQAEAIEMVVPENAFFIDQPLVDIRFPAGVCIAFIANAAGELRTPQDRDVIRAGDRVVIFALETAVRSLEDAIAQSTLLARRFG
jgi:trk system potassium uptake protein TrkA